MTGLSIRSTAPVRICDVGGWTDTWFARSGAVFSIAVEPLVEVRLTAAAAMSHDPEIVLSAPDLGERYAFTLDAAPGRLPLLEATLCRASIPDGVDLDLTVTTGVPPGCGTGTSAAVVVALLGALDQLTPGSSSPRELAAAAHRVETDGLGQQSGVQDQLASVTGGINLFEVRYPDAAVHAIKIGEGTRAVLERRLVLVWLGHPHRSSAIHQQVIDRLAASGGRTPALDALRDAAREAAAAAAAGDLDGLGRSMRVATEAQRLLHPSLVSVEAEAIIGVAASAGASGWKPNGAGGDGGSLTLLAGPEQGAEDVLLAGLAALPGAHEVLPVRLARHGLQVSRST